MKKREFISLTLACFAAIGLNAQLGPQEAVSQMKRGINMGNTLEPPHEDDWNNPPAQEVYFDMYRDAGFDVVRVPVRWHYHTSNTAPFTVDETWMDRVEQVVDWGLSRDLFIVINTHHEEWIKAEYNNPVNRARFDSIWSQISMRFQDKSEKLLFEIINEPKGLTQAQNNELHERVLGIIRRTNPTRNVIIQGHEWGGSDQLITMAIPDDDYLIGSFHSYDPWPFGLEGTGSFGSASQLQELENKFIKVREWSDNTGLPVFLGEFGCHQSADYNSRMKHYRAYINFSLKYGFTPCAWDDGGNFHVMKRSARKWNEIKDILMYCDPGSPTISSLSIEQDTLVSIQWTNGTGGQDSISVQRKSGWGSFVTIATLDADGTSFMDAGARQEMDHYYRIVAFFPQQKVTHSNPLYIHMPEYVAKVRSYFLGAPHQVPGTIEAEDFDMGGEGLSYHDLDSRNVAGAYRTDEAVDIYALPDNQFHVGNALPGEWYEYSLEAGQAGDYLIEVYCAAPTAGGRYLISLGEVVSDTMEITASGNWIETRGTSLVLNLPEGEQIMRFTVIDQPMFSIDKFVFSMESTGFPLKNRTQSSLILFQESGGDLLIKSTQFTVLTRVQIYDLMGKLIAERGDQAIVQRIPGHQLPEGVYLVRAFEDGVIHTGKILIQ